MPYDEFDRRVAGRAGEGVITRTQQLAGGVGASDWSSETFRAAVTDNRAHVAASGQGTLDLLTGGRFVEGQHGDLRFDLDLEGALLLQHVMRLRRWTACVGAA